MRTIAELLAGATHGKINVLDRAPIEYAVIAPSVLAIPSVGGAWRQEGIASMARTCIDCGGPRSDGNKRIRCRPCWDAWARTGALRTDPVPRFWAKVRKTDGCWLWAGSLARMGYGVIGGIGAHRFSWELHFGPIPDGLMVCHHCDVRHCVRPDHLFLGTALDNMRDAAAKGRLWQQKDPERHRALVRRPRPTTSGERNPFAKLTEADVRAIRASSETNVALGRRFGIHETYVGLVRRGKAWTHVS